MTAGDELTLADGSIGRVRWLGRRRAMNALLVRFVAGSLGHHTPVCDLLVSDDHGMFVDGVVVPARLLVNDQTISFERRDTTLYHVELERHGIVLAEGAAAESYLDTGNRRQFGNCPLGYDPSEAARQEPCAEMVLGGPRLKQILARLALVACERIVHA